MRLRDMTVVVTGGGTGIGRAIATLFAREGADVVICGRRAEPIDQTVKAIGEAGGKAIAVIGNVTEAGDVRQLLDATLATFGKVDVLVNNAGSVISRTTVMTCSEEDWRATIEANLHSTFMCSKYMLPELIRRRGNIVAMDLGPAGVRVNALCPAYVETDMNKDMLEGLRNSGAFGSILSKLPLGRLGEADDVAFAALYLASPEARWVTGITLPVDGGMSAGRP
jgi:NAD(P)-dependent dehydrogenase (short-subunit alcohol dehydrogenase family)